MKQNKILMLGKPGGTLTRTYNWHIQALNQDTNNRSDVEDVNIVTNNFSKEINIGKYDIFWFYAKAFSPDLFNHIKQTRPDAKFICGPNILLDKPDVGISDDWDRWYVESCRPDLHLDQVEFYSEHVKKFLSIETRNVSFCLDKCMRINDSLYDKNIEKTYDCLLYSKKRRYDHKFESFRNKLIDLLEENKIKYFEIKAGKFGSYDRDDYFKALNGSKVMINLSLDECPGILNYESMIFNVPVIGSRNNVPVTSCKELLVDNTDTMTDKYLVRNENASEIYFDKLVWFLENESKLNKIDHRAWIKNHTSFKRYADNVATLLERII